MAFLELERPLIDGKFRLEKYDGKGGWTFIAIPFARGKESKGFRSIKVKGTIDDFEIKDYRLMPMAAERLFFSVKAEIRKRIRKEPGDWVDLVLYRDDVPMTIPKEITDCLEEEPGAYEVFLSFSESERKYYIDWVYSAKKEETKIERIVKMIDRLLLKKKFYHR